MNKRRARRRVHRRFIAVRYTASNIASGKGGRILADDSKHGKLSRRIKRAVDVTRAWARKLADNAEWIFGKKAARVLGVLALFAVVVALLLVFLDWYIAPKEPADKKDLVLALAQILAGTALLSGLFFTWRSLQVNREGQITDRFTRAIDQLGKTDDDGNKLLEIRLGGIYALERIARESEEDHWPIMEVLTAYVRQHARWLPEVGQEGREDAAVDKKSKEDPRERAETTGVSPPDPDIQAILTVLRRRTHSVGYGEPEPLVLRETNLARANLSEAHLVGAHFMEANLSGAYLRGANLRGANLRRASLSVVRSLEHPLRGARFGIRITNLSGANLSGAYLREATLENADLSEATLENADLIEADLSGANLRGVDLSGASLSGANLSSANLREANLTQAQLQETLGDEYTRLPSNLKAPTHWGVETDEKTEGD